MVGNQQFGEGFPPIRRPSAIVPRPPPRRSLGRTCQDKLRPSGIPSGQRHPSCSRRGRFLPGRRVEMRRASSQSRKGLSSRWSTNTAKPARLGFTDIRPLPVREPRRYYGVPIPFTPGRWSFDKRPFFFEVSAAAVLAGFRDAQQLVTLEHRHGEARARRSTPRGLPAGDLPGARSPIHGHNRRER